MILYLYIDELTVLYTNETALKTHVTKDMAAVLEYEEERGNPQVLTKVGEYKTKSGLMVYLYDFRNISALKSNSQES